MTTLSYSVVSPVHDDAASLLRLAECMVAQTCRPVEWVIVDCGTNDETTAVARRLPDEHPWIKLLILESRAGDPPASACARAFREGLTLISDDVDVIARQDSNVSFQPDYFERLLSTLARDPKLGVVGGTRYELRDAVWVQADVPGDHVHSASRAYRRACLDDILPLEEGVGWDGIDELKAVAAGWRTCVSNHTQFHHHVAPRPPHRSGSARWIRQGAAARYMGYRFSYIVLRSVYQGRRRPAALAMIWGYARSAIEREPLTADLAVRSYLRDQQRLSRLARGRRGTVAK